MSSSDVLLTVVASDEASEIFVVDGTFRVLAHGVYAVHTRVPPGIYRAKARIGDQQNEQLFTVDAGEQTKLVRLAPLEFASPIPLNGTSTTHEYHQAAIATATAVPLGHAASLVLFLRDPSTEYLAFGAAELEVYARSFQRFVLRDYLGRFTHRLQDIAVVRPEQGYLVLHAEVDPGAYVLCASDPAGGETCIPLLTHEGWSLQVYVTMQPVPGHALERRANLDSAAIVFDRKHSGFDPWRSDLKVLETVRHALARGHNILDERAMNDLLNGKFQNPMIGLMGAHMLLLSREPNLSLAELVIANTASLLGADFPDLRVIRWKLEQLKTRVGAEQSASALVRAVKVPPMLRLSWDYLIEALRMSRLAISTDDEPYSLASDVVASSVWLTWAGSEHGRRKHGHSVLTGTQMKRLLSLGAATAEDALVGQPDRSVTEAARPKAFRLLAAPAPSLQTVRLLMRMLARAYDWAALVRSMKLQDAQTALRLSPAQRQLILALRSARNQLDQGGAISLAFVEDWLDTQGLPVASVLADLTYVETVAAALLRQNEAGA